LFEREPGGSGEALELSYEDFRNHTRWSDYETAIEDMMKETATNHAPWLLIPANNKPYGRIGALRILADRGQGCGAGSTPDQSPSGGVR
jgi:polyphosphate kinase 2 (PPK2 family)